MKKFIEYLLVGAVYSLFFALISYLCLNYSKISFWSLSVLLTIIILITVFTNSSSNTQHYSNTVNGEISRYSYATSGSGSGCNLFIIIMLVVLLIPSIYFTWFLIPENKNKSIKLTVFIVSLFLSLGYYILSRDQFDGPSQVVGFFGGATVGPVSVTELFL